METLFRIEGSEPGATSVILVGVHGDESFGVRSIESMLPINIKRGTLIVAIGNPRAVEMNKRYVDFDLNRAFFYQAKGYEAARVEELKKILDEADVLLDIHSSFVPDTQPFAICEPNAYGIVKQIPVSRTVSGFDQFQPGGTDYYMNKRGGIGICVECGYSEDAAAVELAKNVINSFLVAQGHIEGATQERQQEYDSLQGMYITETNFTPARMFSDFEKIQKDQLIGTDGGKEVFSPIDGFILFCAKRIGSGEEGFVYGKAVTSSDVTAMG